MNRLLALARCDWYSSCFSAPPGAADVLSESARLPVTEHVFENGMRFLIVERRESPPSPPTFASRLAA